MSRKINLDYSLLEEYLQKGKKDEFKEYLKKDFNGITGAIENKIRYHVLFGILALSNGIEINNFINLVPEADPIKNQIKATIENFYKIEIPGNK